MILLKSKQSYILTKSNKKEGKYLSKSHHQKDENNIAT